MAENKKSVIVYAEWIDSFEDLTDAEAGVLIKHFFKYINDKNPVLEDRLLLAHWKFIERSLKRDLQKWDVIREKRSLAGKKSAEIKALNKAQQSSTKSTSVESVQQDSTKSTVNVNGNVNVNVNGDVNENVNDILLEKETKDITTSVKKVKTFSEEILSCYDYCLKCFEDHLKPKTEPQKQNWLQVIEKLERIDKIPLKMIYEVTKAAREDDFWCKNFLSLPKLRKNNPEGIKYIVVFNEKFIKNGAKQKTNEEIFKTAMESEAARNFRY